MVMISKFLNHVVFMSFIFQLLERQLTVGKTELDFVISEPYFKIHYLNVILHRGIAHFDLLSGISEDFVNVVAKCQAIAD